MTDDVVNFESEQAVQLRAAPCSDGATARQRAGLVRTTRREAENRRVPHLERRRIHLPVAVTSTIPFRHHEFNPMINLGQVFMQQASITVAGKALTIPG
jgi:hypothetical protein